MFVEVVATPPAASPVRPGERFTLRASSPLKIGPSRHARIRHGSSGADLELRQEESGAVVRVPLEGPRASLDGLELHGASDVPLLAGATLYLHPGLVLRAETEKRAAARDAGLEGAIHRHASDEVFGVYRDFLEEWGDPLAEWMRRGPTASAAERRAQLGPLADAHRGALLAAEWGPWGFLESVTLERQAVVSAPGVFWHLEQLGRLPVARFARAISVSLFAGAVTGLGEVGTADELAARALLALAAADFAPGLQRVSLGFLAQAGGPWPLASQALGRLEARMATPGLGGVLRTGGRAVLRVERLPRGVTALTDEVVLNPSRSLVGSAPTCLVRLVGDVGPQLCTFHRQSDGQWVVWDEAADPFRARTTRQSLKVNGASVLRATVGPGDLVEPVAGLWLRVELGHSPELAFAPKGLFRGAS